jgi:biotin carboxyl carrier protein
MARVIPNALFCTIVNNQTIANQNQATGVPMHKVRSEVTGSVWKVEVAVGQRVAEGDTLLIVESMKMEIPVSALADGIVFELLVAEGELVVDDQVLAILE